MSKILDSKNLEQDYELGKLYRDRGDFDNAIAKFEPLSQDYFESKRYDDYLKCLNDLLRIYAEQEDAAKIQSTKEKLQDIAMNDDFEMSSYTYYTLGICGAYKGQYDIALDYFQKALTLGLQNENKKDMCYAIAGLAITYSQLGKYQEALQELYNLKVFFEVLSLPELKISSQILNGVILRKTGRHEQSLEVLWECYDYLKTEKNHYFYLQLLYAIGVTYKEQGDVELAKIYLQLLKKSIDANSFVRLAKDTEKRLLEIGVSNQDEYDLIFDLISNSVTERKKGKVDFNNQFILLELLHLFMKYPGETFSKEAIVKKIWNQEYSPVIHDNKIYVTIKRLRKMIEPDYNKPKYIFRAKSGYFFNKASRVRLNVEER
ncbi:MAG: winged helix-turn-helix domain-containing protein [Bdellovibrionota bacterium]